MKLRRVASLYALSVVFVSALAVTTRSAQPPTPQNVPIEDGKFEKSAGS